MSVSWHVRQIYLHQLLSAITCERSNFDLVIIDLFVSVCNVCTCVWKWESGCVSDCPLMLCYGSQYIFCYGRVVEQAPPLVVVWYKSEMIWLSATRVIESRPMRIQKISHGVSHITTHRSSRQPQCPPDFGRFHKSSGGAPCMPLLWISCKTMSCRFCRNLKQACHSVHTGAEAQMAKVIIRDTKKLPLKNWKGWLCMIQKMHI